MLSYSKLALAVLNLQGNKLGGQGLKMLRPGLKNSASITSLSMADNGIGDSDEDLEALKALAAALVASQTLTHVDILYNRIGEKGANALSATFGPRGPALGCASCSSTRCCRSSSSSCSAASRRAAAARRAEGQGQEK